MRGKPLIYPLPGRKGRQALKKNIRFYKVAGYPSPVAIPQSAFLRSYAVKHVVICNGYDFNPFLNTRFALAVEKYSHSAIAGMLGPNKYLKMAPIERTGVIF